MLFSLKRLLLPMMFLALASAPAWSQSPLSILLGDNAGISINTGLIDLELLDDAERQDSLLSVDLLSGDTLLGVGLSGQDILLLGAPSGDVDSLGNGVLPLLDMVAPEQTAVIEFLQGSTLMGDVEPTVFTLSLPDMGTDDSVTGQGEQDRIDSQTNKPINPLVHADIDCIDRDHDAVCDTLDRCPDSPPGAMVLPSGCHLSNNPLELQGVAFATGTATLTPASALVLDQAALILQQYLPLHPDKKVEVAGHTDDTGTVEDNRRLSRQRADAVRRYLIKAGITPSLLMARGYGSRQPKVKPDSLEGTALVAARVQNRRVELRLLQAR